MSVPSATTPTAVPLLEVRDVTKSFGSVAAVSGVSFPLYGGEAHALVGENGAGKSTIVKMLAGVHKPDTGTLLAGSTPITLDSPAAAKAEGIAVIYQEPTLFPDLTIAENIYIGAQPTSRGRMIDRGAMNAAAEALFTRLGVPMDPNRLASGLSIADQQLVEIAKALSTKASVIVMDEPTAALSGNEVARLFKVARSLCADGAAVLFISHRFEEIFDLCQRVTVMRDGKHISTAPLAGLTVDDLIKQMVGRELGALFPKLDVVPGAVILEVENLTRAGVFTDVSFQVRAGEIVALAGLVGAGRSEVMQAVFGVDPRDSGSVKVRGKELKSGNPKAAMRAGIALVPEDRRQQGLIPEMSIERNATLTRSQALSRFGFLVGGGERRSAQEWTKKLQTKFSRITDPVGTLSGGNQQKVVLAKWLATDPIVLIVDEPTRGIDVGTKAEVHKIISRLASEGVAVVMISSELPEVLGMADRVLVMREGRIAAEIDRDHATEESVMFAAMGSESAA
ncbi:sugar ABC transporter ATP-binding protein [Rhodococcus sp. BP-349]|uniref:sugar ABC transporter ATP-binding protein n=1 Tax=unclassified Rhodococcus (in: high G+C Gram-positive bacteria) TaxID=192944 RepID=UPI001C9AFB94|nr:MULTISPECIES: sugar ABC transporter ATP-binding protein [unclassified Rhodococcus (in: high G+C Gram-positive bacteria)]MBY6540015.1 sugar ABC transporter ATP-binding protein [Rhodococcus sp. BP-363]MBY6543657.1 sugar ABC transporter ATP-binding protein [Rhodococcus sp. BP-369]MBY6562887.1 sugar ABC transporter ATP-binding protein [Rhodococcus sp. BP-370]MBY6577179.1 sugar ABC transporter ATP-binding protein [Rhodococcus sp. BP-364]MBY6586480.1 sugar ABC transporter ATP-binding protein [Rho